MNAATKNTTQENATAWRYDNRGPWSSWSRVLTLDGLQSEMEATACASDECDGGEDCDSCVLAMAWDLRAQFPRGVVVTLSGGSSPFGQSFPRMTAERFGREVATVSGFWDIAEGLSNLLAEITQ